MLLQKVVSLILFQILAVQLLFSDNNFSLAIVSYGTVNTGDALTHVTLSSSLGSARFTTTDHGRNAILFSGDILLARNVETLMRRRGFEYPFLGINIPIMFPSAYVVGNFESSIPEDHVQTKAGMMNFSVDAAFLPALKEAGFTHLSLANNHMLDHGKNAFLNTVSQLQQNNFLVFGLPEKINKDSVQYVDLNGKHVALIAIHGLAKISDKDISTTIRIASAQSDFQVVYVHWGTEYQIHNDATQRNLAEKFVNAGADLIIGHHPHVVQNIDLIHGVPVFYSLGNYIFDQYLNSKTEEGLLLELSFSDGPEVHLIPVSSIRSPSQPRLLQQGEYKNFLASLATRSHPDLQASIERGTVWLDSLVATSTKIAMIDP